MLIDNFNDASNLQGLGTTIVDYNPTTKKLTTVRRICRAICAGCPGGVGLITAMTMLKIGLGDRRQRAEHRRHHRRPRARAA